MPSWSKAVTPSSRPDFLDDLAVDHLQDCGSCEMHLAAGRYRQTAHQEAIERRAVCVPPPSH